MKLSIGFKLSFAIMLIVSLFAVVSLVFVKGKIENSLLNIVKEEFSQTMTVVENNFDFMEQSSIYMAYSVMNDTQFIDALIKKDNKKVSYLLEKAALTLQVDNIILLNKNANIIGQIGLFNNDANNLQSYHIVHESMRTKEPLSAIERVGDIFVFYTAVPILKENNLLGAVLIGLQLSNNVLSEMSSGSNIEFAIVGDRAIGASSFKLKNGDPLVLLPVNYTEYLLLLTKKIDLLVTHIENDEYFVQAKELKLVDSDVTNASLMMLYNKDNYNKNLSQINDIQVFSIISLFISLLLSVLVLSFYLKNKFSKLIKGLKRVSDGEYDYKLQINTRDEFYDLGNYFNNMSFSLQTKNEEIKKHVADLEQHLKDINALQKSEKVLYEKATKDFLTGLDNREKFQSMFDFMQNSSLRNNKRIALSIMDIDFFKKVNDTYGHLVGDEVLKSMANILNSNMRKDDALARWGGEEFIVAMQVKNINEAYQILEKLRKIIEEFTFDIIGKVTCSFGVSLLKSNEEKISAFQRVDEALYEAKENGRNRIVMK